MKKLITAVLLVVMLPVCFPVFAEEAGYAYIDHDTNNACTIEAFFAHEQRLRDAVHRARKTIDPNRPVIALTFDDGPSQYTSKIVEALNRNGARATFFVVGSRVSTYASELKNAYLSGSEIGNHSYSHKKLTSLDFEECAEQIRATDDAVYAQIGVHTSVMRSPYGSSSEEVLSAAGKPNILWSIDTLDWKTRDAQATYDNVVGKVKDGDIVLMHDLYSATADAADMIIDELARRGYQMVTVSELGEYKYGGLENKVYARMK